MRLGKLSQAVNEMERDIKASSNDVFVSSLIFLFPGSNLIGGNSPATRKKEAAVTASKGSFEGGGAAATNPTTCVFSAPSPYLVSRPLSQPKLLGTQICG